MAAVSLVSRGVRIETGPNDIRNASIADLFHASVFCDNNGVAAVGGTDTITIDLAAAIAANARDGKTVTVQTIAINQALITRTSAGVEVAHAAYATLSSGVMTVVPKSDGYLTGSTSNTISATAEVIQPYGVYCSYTLA